MHELHINHFNHMDINILRTEQLQFRCTGSSYAFYNERGKYRHKNYLYHQSPFNVVFSS